METESIELEYNEETGCWEQRQEPYMVLEIPTEADWNHLNECVRYWNEHHDIYGNEVIVGKGDAQ